MKWARRALTGAVTALLAIGLPVTANAEVWYAADGRQPAVKGYGDISRLQVDNAPRKVYTKVLFHRAPDSILRVYYDTRRADPGPEFVLSVTIIDETYGVDHWDLNRIDRFHQRRLPRRDDVVCRGDRASLTQRLGVYAVMPRRCLAIGGMAPSSIRVSTWSFDRYDRHRDWAPSRHRFGPWLEPA